MSELSPRELIERHWQYANQADWQNFSRLLDDNLYYEVPQTREYIQGGHGYLDMFQTWPGVWRAEIKELICEVDKVLSVIDFHCQGETMTGLSLFYLKAGKIIKVTDYWPDSYEPPKRQGSFWQRYPSP